MASRRHKGKGQALSPASQRVSLKVFPACQLQGAGRLETLARGECQRRSLPGCAIRREQEMKLGEFLDVCIEAQGIIIRVSGADVYEGKASECPMHLRSAEVTKMRDFCEDIIIDVVPSYAEMLTWRQIADAIERMPEWAQDMPAMVYMDEQDDSVGISEMLTYYSKEPSEILDDGDDFVFLVPIS